MIFLLEYDRSAGQLVSLEVFDSTCREQASKARLELEISLMTKGLTREVVVLEAASEDALRKSHSRYFRDVRQMGDSIDQINRKPSSS
ncbi:hypothetical protein OVA13_11375 [Pseudoxanthomonas sp. SL93]|uniref:hypothetical protein n=1 Tax=Pseudoxanthomonas sp. SL93 TaxID=2995142 RepID=UPI0022707EBE|nr:hypothetical protein [Pseudoxanthomonas sp. SL93]WAC62004.1 hypothetical protein OVA13_11375 [Pseudoxanthomonas sp. SL93]